MTAAKSWERVDAWTTRIKVPGGWLYEVFWYVSPQCRGYNLMFVPEATTKGDDK